MIESANVLDYLNKKSTIFESLHHYNIVDQLFHFSFNTKFYVITEFIKNKQTLQEIISSSGPLSEENTKFIIRQLHEAIKYLHNKNISHLGLKLKNLFMINTRLKVKFLYYRFNFI